MSDQSTLATPPDLHRLRQTLAHARQDSITLIRPLSAADRLLSGALWHLGHTTWFLEHYLLRPFAEVPLVGHPLYEALFASPAPPAARPAEDDILAYRRRVDETLGELLDSGEAEHHPQIASLVELALHHEWRHQEALLEDILRHYAADPFRPVYREPQPENTKEPPPPLGWLDHPGGEIWIGKDENGFAFDDERPRHRRWLAPFQLADRLITNGEYQAFMEDGGYHRPELWLETGWRAVHAEDWRHPAHWQLIEGRWWAIGLHGLLPLDPNAPVTHVSYYEADAYARWAGARLPDEAEWETLASRYHTEGDQFRGDGLFLPRPAHHTPQFHGSLWEWTRSPYAPYPGHRPPSVVTAEFDGCFPPGEMVLRGGSCITPQSAARLTRREHAAPACRDRFTGLRLARDLH